MIRYVLAALLTVAVIALSLPAIQSAAGVASERGFAGDVAAIDDAAVSLLESEEPTPDGVPAPRRTVTVPFPADSLTRAPIAYLRIERIGETGSLASYATDGRAERQHPIDAPIVHADPTANETVELGGVGERRTLALTLQRDGDGDPVVVATD
ncbi:hypothetical protein SAMN05444422_11322 [Halobiforma haloterrestris]|uniref:DUF7311 domain-containing protein n=1 Tax=Natronobacterium haloterrestre TaxID=148448 RepID=A0A1I1L193_NATHA|nr:hypothetical protein [Halobiforma haloterrestris]SFC64748.1 hypothetical protein SAMN05444422_11322 [Halobiforma haloterrestris]